MMPFHFLIDLPAHNDWGNIDLLRGSVQNCFTAMFRNVDCCHALAMITGELLENAVKYGSWQGEPKMFRLRVWGEERRAFVCVENPVRDGERDVQRVMEILAWIKTFPSAADAYRAKLVEVASQPQEGSRLGLVRIAYEGGCTLTAELEGGVLSVTASVPLTPG